jgi:hypothetical protein
MIDGLISPRVNLETGVQGYFLKLHMHENPVSHENMYEGVGGCQEY